MLVDDIRVFVPSKNFEESKKFYKALGFNLDPVSDKLVLFTNGDCSFFLQDYYQKEFAENLMMQLSVVSIDQVFDSLQNLKNFNIKFDPIKQESWGKVIYLWGPGGELWHITEFA